METTETQEWKVQLKPFYNEPIDLEMLGADIRIKKFMIYEDAKVKAIHVKEPTYANEFNNYVRLIIKNGAFIIEFPIGGYINLGDAINNAKEVAAYYNSSK